LAALHWDPRADVAAARCEMPTALVGIEEKPAISNGKTKGKA
jgi:hypothetical protein